MHGPLVVEQQGPVTVVTIDRPERRNAVDRPTADALLEVFEAFDADEDASVAVLTGAHGTFCAGADLQAIAGGTGNRVAEDGAGPMGPTRLELSKPVVAAVEGHAVAGGLELAVWCDLRVAAADAVLGVYCRRFGVPLVDGGTVRLPRLVGQGRAMDLILSGRGVGAEEALAMGLVNRIGTVDDALSLARSICQNAPIAVGAAKHAIDEGAALELDAALTLEGQQYELTLHTADRLEGLKAFAQKREPVFTGR